MSVKETLWEEIDTGILDPPQDERRNVLIVDDDVDFAETIAEIIEPHGYYVRLAHNAVDAMEIVVEFQPHVALLDIRLGRDNGTDLISRFKANTPDVLCVMMTGYAALETAIQALKDGAYDYMRKPVSPGDLFATLDRCFQTVDLIREKRKADRTLAIRNKELECINSRLRQVVTSAGKMTACTKFRDLGPLILEECAEMLNVYGGSLFVVKGNRLDLVHSLQDSQVPAHLAQPLPNRSVFARVLQKKEPVLITDFNHQNTFSSSNSGCYMNGSALVFPMMDDRNQVGALLALHNKKDPPFSTNDLEVGSILVSLAEGAMRTQQAFGEVEEGRRRFREMTELLPAIVFELDEHGCFTFVSRQAEEITGFSREELYNHFHVTDLMVHEERPQGRAVIEETLSGNKLVTRDFSILCRDNNTITVLARARSIVREGRSVGVRGLFFDITERKQVEQEHAQLAMAVEQAAELIMITDVNGVIKYTNPAFRRLTGYSQEQTRRLNFHSFENAKEDDRFYEHLWEQLNRGEVWQGRVRARKADNTLYETEASISPLRNRAGRVVNYVTVLRDLTHEATLEARLRQAEKLEAIGTLAGGIAHDFNNILSPIIGFTEIVREDLPVNSDSSGHLDKVLKACYMAKELVSRILTFSRQVETERKTVKVDNEVREALKLLRPSIPSTIAIEQDLDEGQGVVMADPSQIHQLIMNLCTNAYQAMLDQGVLQIKLTCFTTDAEFLAVHPRLTEGKDYLHLRVCDTGMGMNEETMKRIFDPFFSTKEQGKGTGLGLATVHGIVMELNGDITVSSEVGQGTCVDVYLARHEEVVVPPETHLGKATQGGMERILFVDDEEMILQLGEKMLSRLGYVIEAVVKSPEALEIFRADPTAFDLIITDQTMPFMTGQQLAEQIKKIRPDIPILLTTGFSSALGPDILARCGISQVIHKPFTRKEIGDAIRKALEAG